MVRERRKFSNEQKLAIIAEAAAQGVACTLHDHQLSYSVLARWRRQFDENKMMADPAGNSKVRHELKHIITENTRLKKIIADLALELERKEEDLRKYNSSNKR